MVLSQYRLRRRLQERRAVRNRSLTAAVSSQTLSARSRLDDTIGHRRNTRRVVVSVVPSIVQTSQDDSSSEIGELMSNRELVVLLRRHPLIRATAVMLNSQDRRPELVANINRGRQLRVVLRRNFGDIVGPFVCPSSFRPALISAKEEAIREIQNLSVRLERNAVISDMAIFNELRKKRIEGLARLIIPSKSSRIADMDTPSTPPLRWPDTPSPMVLASPSPYLSTPMVLGSPLPNPFSPMILGSPLVGHDVQITPHDTSENTNRRRKHADVPHRVTYRHGTTFTPEQLEILCAHPHHCGSLVDTCTHCGALHFTNEKKGRDGDFSKCCSKGAFSVPPLRPCPPAIKDLYTGNGPLASQFRNNIRYLNSLFAMASFKSSRPVPERRGQGHWSFSICGQIYHFICGLPTSQDLRRPQLNQFYFLDVEEALEKRNAFSEQRVDPKLLKLIENTLRLHNPFILAYKTMGEEIEERKAQNMDVDNIIIGMTKEPVINILAAQQNSDWRPGRSDIAAIFEGPDPPVDVDLVLYPHKPDDPDPSKRHQELKLLSPFADPKVYPMLFPCGDCGYCTTLKYKPIQGRATDKTVTILQYYRYRIYIRDSFSTIHHGGKLFQQYILDGYVKHEMSRLWWFRQNQHNFRKTAEEVLRRFNRNREQGHVGRVVVLPSNFPGGERHRQRQYLDAMAVVARFGKPDLFITFTCNPKWPEITENLFEHQKWEDRPDLVCRVFQMKLTEFMHDIIHKQLYGVVINHQYVIEFQKRGLPHAHIVITLHDDDKLRDVEMIDRIISARIPDRTSQPLLYSRVAEFQLHAPCGRLNPQAPCLQDGKCSKYFPKPFREETALAVGHIKRPEYRRPADGREIFVERWNRSINNRRVVPYNAYALAKFKCHCNFEAVGSLNSIKYLHKYVNKGPDSVTLYVDETEEVGGKRIDEIQSYLDSRYLSAMEATWKIFQYHMHVRSHSVLALPIHLPGERAILYNEDDDVEDIERRLDKRSKLEAWFLLNQHDADARMLKYVQIPEHYLWDDKNARWTKRSQISKQIGCLIQVSPSEGQIDKFFLRILLKRIKGAVSFDDLLTLENGYRCESFKESCQKRNWLVEDGGGFEMCLKEAELHHHPRKFRKLFALICCVVVDEDVAQIEKLWLLFRKSLRADFRRSGMGKPEAERACIREIQNIVSRCRPGLSLVNLGVSSTNDGTDSADDSDSFNGDEDDFQNDYEDDGARPRRRVEYKISLLNRDQKVVFLRVLNACARKFNFIIPLQVYDDLGEDVSAEQLTDRTKENCFYLDGPGGTGKTFLYNTLISVLNDLLDLKTIAVAWTGIAANILIGGTTVHRSFRLPLTLSEDTVCGFDMESPLSEFIKNKVALIIWDEAPMTPRFAVESVSRYLMDIMRRAEPFGGKCVLFGGDFRQILPVVLGGHRNDCIASCLKSSRLWSSFTKLKLQENMRVKRYPETAVAYEDLGGLSYGDWLLKLGEGSLPFIRLNKKVAPVAPEDLIEIPPRFHVTSVEDLIDFVYGKDFSSRRNGSRAILCPTNAAVDFINDLIFRRMEGDEIRTYLSEDSYCASEEDDFLAPLDLLNSINCASLPPHELVLKRGSIVMLLRNLDVDEGECNGSRMRVIKLGDQLIECELLTGQRIGETLLLPRIKMKAQDSMLPREIVRLQFPIKLAYAMTINKSQGQTLDKVGICLKRPCFTHGQLYVAFSRVGSVNDVRIFMEDSGKQGSFKYRGRKRFTRNIVFSNVLDVAGIRQQIDCDMVQEDCGGRESRPAAETSMADFGGQESDPDCVSENEDAWLAVAADQVLDEMDSYGNNSRPVAEIGGNDDDFWMDAVPFRTASQLAARVSDYNRPGTSGLNLTRRLSLSDRSCESSDSE